MKAITVQQVTRAKYARIHDIRATHGLPDSTLYRLIHAGLIRSVDVRRPGTTRGTRLIDLESLENYLSSLAEAQAQ
jgi:hypothetical protein